MHSKNNAKRKRATDEGSEPLIENHFKDVMDSCVYDWVDPHDCIPFTMTRPVSKSGVLKLMNLFDGLFDGSSINGGGISCGTDTSIVVKLDGVHLLHVCDYFKKKGYSESMIKERISSRKNWYGIVDGEHSHAAILRLIETKKRWAGYRWFVTIIKSGFNIEKYRQLARMQNERHNDQFYIETTFFDMISNMRTEYDKLRKVQSRVLGQDVVNAYCGYTVTSKKTSTLVQTANTAIRLPVSVVRAIGEVSNLEQPDLVLSSTKLNSKGATSVEEAMRMVDCRVFRKFLHVNSIRASKAFMNAKHKYGERAQVYAIYRVQDVYRQRCFSKAIQPDELTHQYEMALYSIEEEEKFCNYIAPDKWPAEMNTIRDNLLKTVQLSEEVSLNHGNKEILPCLLSAFKRHFPTNYMAKMEAFRDYNNEEDARDDKGSIEHTNEQDTVESCPPVDSSTPDENAVSSTEVEEDLKGVAETKSDTLEKDSENESNDGTANSLDQKLKSLREKGVNCHNLDWQEFSKEVWTMKDKRLDAIITEPPPSPSLSFIEKNNKKKNIAEFDQKETSSSDILQIVKSGKEFLKPGGYFIVLIEFELFQEWYLAFKANGFSIMKRPLTFCYKPDCIPRKPSEEEYFPYGLEEYCIVARLSGSHPDSFNPDFSSSFNLINCNWSKRASIVTNVDVPKNKLCYEKSRKPVRVSEKPIDLLAEIIDLFVPPYGTVMDLFGGTLTLPIASLKTSRRCIAIESDKKCFELAVHRLSKICSPVFKFIVNNKSLHKAKEFCTVTIQDSTTTKKNINVSQTSAMGLQTSVTDVQSNFLSMAREETSKDVDDIQGQDYEKEISTTEDTVVPPKCSTEANRKGKDMEPPAKSRKKSIEREASETLLLLTK